jgi:hypothetical protein
VTWIGGTSVTVNLSSAVSGSAISGTVIDGAYIYFPRLSVAELCTAVNGLFVVKGSALRISWDAAAGQAVLRSNSDGTLTITGSGTNVLNLLGFSSSSFTLGPRATLRAVPQVIRTIEVPVGRFDGPTQYSTLIQNLNRAVAPQWTPDFSALPVLAGVDHTLTAFTVTLPAGHPTVAQLVALINASLPSGIALSHDSTTGKYTIARTDGRAFTLDFASSDARKEAARVLGFRSSLEYEGRSSYTGETRASSGSITLDSTQPRYPIRFVETIAETKSLAADVAGNPHGQDLYYLDYTGSGGIFDVIQASSSATVIPAGLVIGDVLRVNASVSSSARVVTGVVTAVQNNGTRIVVDFEDDVLAGLDTVEMTAVCISRNVALLHGENPLVTPALVGSTDPILAGLSHSSYGPCAEVLGLNPRAQLSLPAALPFVTHLGPPDYILMEIVSPSVADNLHSHVAVADSSRSKRAIIAKFIITAGFARISEDKHALRLTGPQTIDEVRVRFLNPDLSLVDWHGHEHSWTLVLDKISAIPTFLSI